VIPHPSTYGSEDKIISVRDLRFTYEGGYEALKSVNLDIRRGEYVAIVGGNGSGKTTLAKNLNGLLRPTSGSVMINGKPASDMTASQLAKVVGYAFQNPDHQLFCSSVVEELEFGPQNLGYSLEEIESKVSHAIEALHLRSLQDKPPLSLTLGERRRVSIASVVAMDPEVFILDEPTTGLDARETDDLMAGIHGLNREGHTLILITHDMSLVAKHARRVLVMSEGRVVLDSDPGGAFSDLELLRRSKLIPPPVVQLAHRLSAIGIPREILSPEELVFRIMLVQGGSK
jgi:energy-coupling factor transport system ATP-binding protein